MVRLLLRVLFLLKVSFCFLIFSTQIFAQTPTPNINISKEIYIDVGQAGIKKLKMAIGKFSGTSAVSDKQAYNQRLTDIFNFTGSFDFLPEKVFANNNELTYQNITWDDWLALKTEMLIVGKFDEVSKNKFNIELRLYEVKSKKMLLGKKYSQVDKLDVDRALRRFADVCMEILTGELGIFSSKIAFIAAKRIGEPKQVYIANFDGTNPVQVSKGNDINMSPSWSPDGSKLTYTSFRDGKAEIYMYNRITNSTARLTKSQGTNSGAAWSSDGKTIAFSSSKSGLTSIYTMNALDGSNVKVFISGSGLEVEPAYSPDNSKIAFTSGRFGNPHIFVRDFATQKDTRITFAGWYNSSPSWRPDSKKLAFAGYDKQIDRYDLFIVNPDGRQLERLTLEQGDNEKPSWSPDGRFILYQSNRGIAGKPKSRGYKLFVMNRDGGNQRPLDMPFDDVAMPTWGPRLNELDE